MNCLNQAIAEERIHQVRLLLSLNVDSETRDKKDFNRTPLLKASRLQCEDSSQKIMRILIRFGVSVNAVDDSKRTALHYACSDGKCEVIDLLLKEHSIKLNEQDEKGQTPLMLAAINGRLKAARIIASRLVKFDLDVDVRDNKGYTALLHAIMNQNYGIAYDLIRYANACSTIRDNENFKNATEWLQKTVEEKQKLENRARRSSVKPAAKEENASEEEKDVEKDKSSRRGSASVPQLTISSLPVPNANEVPMTEYSLARMVAESPSKASLLYEQLPYQNRSRPTSSALSKASASSAKNPNHVLIMPPASEQIPNDSESKMRPSTAVDDGSVYSCNVSQGSRLGDDLMSTPGRSLFSTKVDKKSKGKSEQNTSEKRASVRSARKSAASRFKVDLGRINIDPSECSLSPTHAEKIFSTGDIKDLPESDLSKDNQKAVEVLMRVLNNQKKGKISRTSTSMSLQRPADEATRKHALNTQPMNIASTDRTVGNSTFKSKPSISTDKRLVNKASKKISMRRFFSQSSLSDDFYVIDHLDPVAIEQAKKNIQTIFSLYTDSLLWVPPSPQPESLMVQTVGNESDKMTLASDLATSVSDLASIPEGISTVHSEDNKQHEVKAPSARSRLVSATSRASRKSARISSSRASSAVNR